MNPNKMDQIPNLENKSPQALREVPVRGKFSKFLPFILIILIVAAGTFSGLVLSSRAKAGINQSKEAKAGIEEEELTGQQKESFNQTFNTQAEGKVEKNEDLDKYAQGTHKLIRPGGEDQTAYLTSSVLDLNEYVGKNVVVYGETFGSTQVGWLMDVGKVEVK